MSGEEHEDVPGVTSETDEAFDETFEEAAMFGSLVNVES
jgi:hypothetical protein